MTLQTFLSKPVRTADGGCLGRVVGFRAEPSGAEIRVTHFRIGPAAWIERLRPHGMLRRLFGRAGGLEIPWEAVASVDREVRLKEGWDRARCEACELRVSEEPPR